MAFARSLAWPWMKVRSTNASFGVRNINVAPYSTFNGVKYTCALLLRPQDGCLGKNKCKKIFSRTLRETLKSTFDLRKLEEICHSTKHKRYMMLFTIRFIYISITSELKELEKPNLECSQRINIYFALWCYHDSDFPRKNIDIFSSALSFHNKKRHISLYKT